VRDVSCGAFACTPSIRSQLPAGGGAGLASLAVLACAPHTAVGADGGAPAVHADAPHSVVLADGGAPAVLAFAPLAVVLADGDAPAVLAFAPHSVVLADGLAFAPHSVVLADGGAPAVLAPAPLAVVLADGGAPAVLAPAPLSVVLADGGAPAILALSPDLPVGADAAAPAVHALTLASAMWAFLPRLRRPGPLPRLPPLRLWLLPPPHPHCRFPLAPALSALAPLLAMPTRALSPASAPTTAPSFSVRVLPLLRLALTVVLHGLAFLGGLAQVALGTVRSTNATGARCGLMRWSRVDSDIPRRMVSRTLGPAGDRAHESCGPAPRGFVFGLSRARSRRQGPEDDS